MTPEGNHSLAVSGLTKSFGHREVLRGIDLDLRGGESLTILGANGAGKTTLLRVLATLAKPNSGKVRLGCWDLLGGEAGVKRSVGFLSHHTLLYDDLTTTENLRFYGRMYRVPDLDARIREMLEMVGLGDRGDDSVRTLSRGMQQRVAIARALLHQPLLVLLDEPFVDLDQKGREMLQGLLARLGGAKMIITATSDLEQGYTIGQRIAILAKGRLIYQGERKTIGLEALRENYRTCAVEGI